MKKKISPLFIALLASLIAVSIVFGVLLAMDGHIATAIAAGGVFICASFVLVASLRFNTNLSKYVTMMDKEIVAVSRETFYDYPEPIIITDKDEKVVWYNRCFEENIFGEDRAYGINLSDLVGNNTSKIFARSGATVKILDKYYNVCAKQSESFENEMAVIRFSDITDHVMLETEYKASRKTVLIMTIDSYEDVLQNAKESDKATVQVQIEQIFERFIESTNGVLYKSSNGRFYAIIEERHLTRIIERKFDILDEVRSIQIGDRSGVTLSIGVGRGAKTLAESEIYAKQALDMCLGRGGDQAAVKTDTGFEFFGGISKAVEKSTRVRSRIIAAALKELVMSCENVYIMGHRFADFDSVGSSIGLCGAFRSLGKPAWCVVDPEKNLSKPLIEYITANGEGELFKSCYDAVQEINERSLLIICDTHNPDFIDSKELYEKAKTVVVIDHHRKMVNYIDNAVVFFHEPFASSASEMAAELIQYFGVDCKISVADAEALLAGIMLDTKNFVMRSGARTFEAAAYLKRLGADTVAVKNLFSDTLATYREKSVLIQSASLFHSCAIATTTSDAPELRLAAPQAADELLGICGVKASFVFYLVDKVCYISARSLGDFNVQLIMEAVGGGGHQTMAGAQLECSIEDAVHKVKTAIDNFRINQ